MGALHAGHLSLVDAARDRCGSVAASIFVNPTQFGPGEDLERYPRDEAGDLAALEARGVAVVFAPAAAEMYPDGFAVTVSVGGPLTAVLEGERRPGHFDGVALVVTKLLNVVRPDVLFLGRKDAQQLAVLSKLVRDLDLPVEVVGLPIVREPDGLAMSSRNAYLSVEQRAAAPNLHGALQAARTAAATAGATPAGVAREAARVLADAATSAGPEASFVVDYLEVVDEVTFQRETELGPRSLLVAAARLGSTRLIDNMKLRESSPADAPLTTGASAYPAGDATTRK